PGNWNQAQAVTVTGVDDLAADGDQAYSILLSCSSSDSTYAALGSPSVSVTNIDDDKAGVTVTPASGLATTEAGGKATFTVMLTSQPTGPVTVTLASSNTAEGKVNVGSVTFTAANWNVPQTVTVTGVNDFVADGDQTYSVVVAASSGTD